MSTNRKGASVMNVTTFGVDLAKNVFQVHGADARGKAIIRRQLRRGEMMAYFANQPPCLIGMEACSSAHHWARELERLGHTVKLMAPQFVKPYVKSNKNDRADAQAICEAVGRPSMRFVPIKSVEQQAVLALHRARQGFVKERTAQDNQIRGLLAEFGVILPAGIGQIARGIPRILGDAHHGLPDRFRTLLARLYDHFQHLHAQVIALEHDIKAWHAQSAASQRAAQVPGVGPITASALVATVGNARDFASARQMAAWLGIVPKQHSTGGKAVLLGISKRGDSYLRTLLIHGARSAILAAQRRGLAADAWLARLLARHHPNVAAVALANKNARILWALLAHARDYQPGYASLAR